MEKEHRINQESTQLSMKGPLGIPENPKTVAQVGRAASLSKSG